MWSGTFERLPDESGWSRRSASSVILSRSPRSLDRSTSNALRNDASSSLFNTLAMEAHPVLAASRGKKKGTGNARPAPLFCQSERRRGDVARPPSARQFGRIPAYTGRARKCHTELRTVTIDDDDRGRRSRLPPGEVRRREPDGTISP